METEDSLDFESEYMLSQLLLNAINTSVPTNQSQVSALEALIKSLRAQLGI